MAETDPLKRLATTLSAGRRRLRLRAAIRWAAAGAWIGAGGAVASGILRQIGVLDDGPATIAAVVGVVVAPAAAGLAGALWRTLDDRETALLLDRALDTDELLVTATWLRSRPPDPRRNAVLDELAEANIPRLDTALPLRVPRHGRWIPVPLAVALVALLAPAWRPALFLDALESEETLVQEGARLAERMEEAKKAQGVELPEGIEREIAKLARDMQGEELSAEDAMKRLEELQQQLDAFEQELADQRDTLDEIEKAAQALDANSATQPLADALRDLDMGAAGDAARDLADKMGLQGPAERQQTADALEQAGKQLQQSSDPAMQQAGQAMEQAAQQARGEKGQQGQGQQGSGEQGQQGTGEQGQQGTGEQGQQGEGQQGEGQQGAGGQGQQGSQGGGLSPEEAQSLAEALEQARQAGEQLQRDEEALQRSQELNGAMEGSRQRLGGEPSVEEGESSGGEGKEGEGQSGSGDGEGEGEGQQGEGGEGMAMAGSGAGQGHTWEDQGEFTDGKLDQEGGRDDGKRTDQGQVVNDFERLYKSVRDEDAQHLLTSVEGKLDQAGHVDELPIRLTGSDETARTSTVQLPDGYREAAAEAVSSEQVPPGYREAVKQYFDEME